MMPQVTGVKDSDLRRLRTLPVAAQIQLWNQLFHTEPLNRQLIVNKFMEQYNVHPEKTQ